MRDNHRLSQSESYESSPEHSDLLRNDRNSLLILQVSAN